MPDSSSNTHRFEEVTLLVTHYNRSLSLEHLLLSFLNQNVSFGEIIVSDDGSKPEHLENLMLLQNRVPFRLITTPKNRGLGNNINKGQNAVTTKYTLYVQEDFEPAPHFPAYFANALELMQTETNWDMVRFYAFPWAKYPYLKPYKMGYSEMVFKPAIWYMNHLKFYYYSDHPHLRRSDFFQKFGAYIEGEKGDKTEYDMCLRFIKRGGKGLMFNTGDLFYHENHLEASTMVRAEWRLSNSWVVKFMRQIYLKGKVVQSTWKLKSM